MNILNNINEEILAVCEVSEIEGEIEEAALVTDRILNTKIKIEAAKKAQNTANVSVVASSTVSVESQIENSPNTGENTGNLASNIHEISASSDIMYTMRATIIQVMLMSVIMIRTRIYQLPVA